MSQAMEQFTKNQRRIFREKLSQAMISWSKAHGERLTHEKLAEKIIVRRETVTRWLNGSSCPVHDGNTMKKLCEFFNVPVSYFDGEGLTLTREDLHEDFEIEIERKAAKLGINPAFVAFIKSTPALADAVMSAMITDTTIQSFSPDVPDTGNAFQFISSTGTKLYPPGDVLLMLRLVQRDLTEYASFLIEKYTDIIRDAFTEAYERSANKNDSGENYISAGTRLMLDLKGRKGLTPSESLLVDAFRSCKQDEQKELMQQAAHLSHKSRKKKQSE